MRRIMMALLASALVASMAIGATSADAQGPTWARGYPEHGQSGCIEYVAQWSDGTYTSVPWDCVPGVVARRGAATANRGYPQLAANGCVEYVAQWSDGTFTWVPFECPPGVTYFKPGGADATPAIAPVAPPAQPLPPSASTPAQRFAGAGKQATTTFTLRGGLTTIHLTHSGQRNFAVWLLDSSGSRVDLLANEIGGFDGTKALGLRAGSYLMDVTADGAWAIEIQQPPTVATGTPPFSGRGKQITPQFQQPTGLVRIRMRHDGWRNFAIWLMDRNGQRIDLLVNEIGPFDGVKAIRIPRSDVYIMDVTADGNWSITFE